MPHVKAVAGGSGSCAELVDYLEKENKGIALSEQEPFFSYDKNNVQPSTVIQDIDTNKKCLRKEEIKFYQVIISPSKSELQHIGSDKEKLRQYTRQVMEEYAANFKKGVTSQDLVWYAKIERTRQHQSKDTAVRIGQERAGTTKAGEQTHIHVLVARQSRQQKIRLSPVTNHRSTAKGSSKFHGGFDRMNFKIKAEQQYDRLFEYRRPQRESVQRLTQDKILQRQDPVFAKVQEAEKEAKAAPVGRTELDRLRAAQQEAEKGWAADRASQRTVGRFEYKRPEQATRTPEKAQERPQERDQGFSR